MIRTGGLHFKCNFIKVSKKLVLLYKRTQNNESKTVHQRKTKQFSQKNLSKQYRQGFHCLSLLHFIGSGASVQSKASKLEVNWNFFSLYSILGDEV